MSCNCGIDNCHGCNAEATINELLGMEAGTVPRRAVRITALQAAAMGQPLLTDDELAELDPSLIGNRLAALTTALGIPPCGGCGQRQEWLNRAHVWLRQ